MNFPLHFPGVVPASQLQRPAPLTVSCGIAAVDSLTGGLPRGALTEICGAACSGRTSLLLAVLAEATRCQEICALVDAGDNFDPHSAAAAGVDLRRLLWVRCTSPPPRRRVTKESTDWVHSNLRGARNNFGREAPIRNAWLPRLEQAVKTTDLLLQGGGFGVVAIDLAGVPPEVVRRVPLASWFRFRRAVDHTATVLLVLEREPHASTCASLVLQTTLCKPLAPISNRQPGIRTPREELSVGTTADTGASAAEDAGAPSHARLLRGTAVEVQVLRAREQKKSTRSAGATFQSRAEWAG